MKNRKMLKPSMALAATLVAALSLSVIAFAAAPIIWQNIENRILQGGEFVNHIDAAFSEDGEMLGMRIGFDEEALEEAGGGAVIVELEDEGVLILRDELSFDNLEEALEILALDNVRMPGYLPEGFAFLRATFPISPIAHPGESRAAGHMFVDFANGDEIIRMQIQQRSPFDREIGQFSGSQEDITIDGNPGAVAPEMIAVIIDDVFYFIDASLPREELVKIAESLG